MDGTESTPPSSFPVSLKEESMNSEDQGLNTPPLVTPDTPTHEETKRDSPKTVEEKADSPQIVGENSNSPKIVEENANSPKMDEEKTDSPKNAEEKVDSPKSVQEKGDSPKNEEGKSDSPEIQEKTDSPKNGESKPDEPDTNTPPPTTDGNTDTTSSPAVDQQDPVEKAKSPTDNGTDTTATSEPERAKSTTPKPNEAPMEVDLTDDVAEVEPPKKDKSKEGSPSGEKSKADTDPDVCIISDEKQDTASTPVPKPSVSKQPQACIVCNKDDPPPLEAPSNIGDSGSNSEAGAPQKEEKHSDSPSSPTSSGSKDESEACKELTKRGSSPSEELAKEGAVPVDRRSESSSDELLQLQFSPVSEDKDESADDQPGRMTPTSSILDSDDEQGSSSTKADKPAQDVGLDAESRQLTGTKSSQLADQSEKALSDLPSQTEEDRLSKKEAESTPPGVLSNRSQDVATHSMDDAESYITQTPELPEKVSDRCSTTETNEGNQSLKQTESVEEPAETVEKDMPEKSDIQKMAEELIDSTGKMTTDYTEKETEYLELASKPDGDDVRKEPDSSEPNEQVKASDNFSKTENENPDKGIIDGKSESQSSVTDIRDIPSKPAESNIQRKYSENPAFSDISSTDEADVDRAQNDTMCKLPAQSTSSPGEFENIDSCVKSVVENLVAKTVECTENLVPQSSEQAKMNSADNQTKETESSTSTSDSKIELLQNQIKQEKDVPSQMEIPEGGAVQSEERAARKDSLTGGADMSTTSIPTETTAMDTRPGTSLGSITFKQEPNGQEKEIKTEPMSDGYSLPNGQMLTAAVGDAFGSLGASTLDPFYNPPPVGYVPKRRGRPPGRYRKKKKVPTATLR